MLLDVYRHLLYLNRPAIIRIHSVTAALAANTGFYKWNITIGWCSFFIVEINMLNEYAGMLISQTIFYNINYAATRALQDLV